MDNKQKKDLMKMAVKARDNAYAPYSGFFVGAALLCKNGKIYTGVNIENASYPAGTCAERTAFSTAINEGIKDFTAIAVAGGPSGGDLKTCPPCGICRQFMREFCDDDFMILLMGDTPDSVDECKFSEILPHSFGPGHLE